MTKIVKTVVLDSYALLAYFEKEPGWETVAALFAEHVEKRAELLLCVVNWGEIDYIVRRTYGPDEVERVHAAIEQLPIRLVNVDRDLAEEAAWLKARGGIAYADCFAAGVARVEEGVVLTGDPEFTAIEDEVSVQWLADSRE